MKEYNNRENIVGRSSSASFADALIGIADLGPQSMDILGRSYRADADGDEPRVGQYPLPPHPGHEESSRGGGFALRREMELRDASSHSEESLDPRRDGQDGKWWGREHVG